MNFRVHKSQTSRKFQLRYFLLLLFTLHISFFTFAQPDSCNVRISLLTCTPGEDLYSTFGHSAFRVTNTLSGEDIVFNYGTFNFEEPGFYTKFIRGKLMYYLSTEDFSSFKEFYQRENRGITDQTLNLSCKEKNRIVQLLQKNLADSNKFYKYDFTFDNCTTRLRDLVENAADSPVHFSQVVKHEARFRELIYEYLNYNDKQWSKLGIDLLLGTRTDAIMNNRQVMFLPDYLMKAFDSSLIGSTRLIAKKKNLYPVTLEKNTLSFYEDPLFIFSCLLLSIILLSASKLYSIQNFIKAFDGFLFFITGLLGILIIFMWLGTDHKMCSNNYNLLWALPTHVIGGFYIHNHKPIAIKYFKITAIVTTLVLAAWFFLPQHMNTSLIPFILLLIYRSATAGFSSNKKMYANR